MWTTNVKTRPAQTVLAPVESARVALDGLIMPGCRIFGFTKGQYSLLDLLRAILDYTGPSDVVISTWTMGIRDTENVSFLQHKGVIRSLLLLVDRSFPGRQPEYSRKVLRAFGKDAIRCTNTHAKFCLISNDNWNIVVRSSMNLNRNRRFEQFDIDDDVDLFTFCMSFVDEMESLSPKGFDWQESEVEDAFDRIMRPVPQTVNVSYRDPVLK